MQTDDAGLQAERTNNPVFGLWMQDRWMVWFQVGFGLVIALLLVVWPVVSDPTRLDTAFAVVGALVVGLLLGASERDMRWRRMVRRHVAAVHSGEAVPNTPGKANGALPH